MPKTIITTFGDMIRVPGTESSLEYARASGAKIEVVYSPAEALIKAKQNPGFKVIFLGVGFETTIPAIAWTIKEADLKNIDNFYVLCAHKTIPQAMAALMKGKVKINGFMCPGHVSVIIGGKAYNQICRDFKIPCVVTGFEPLDMVLGIEMLLQQIADKRAEVEIQYSRSVSERGNLEAQAIIQEVFDVCDSKWRGVGTIPQSGLVIKDKYSSFDAEKEFTDLKVPSPKEHKDCICGEILQGIKLPYDCKLFRKKCTPDTPVGACMVSGEGTCAAYYKYSEREGHV